MSPLRSTSLNVSFSPRNFFSSYIENRITRKISQVAKNIFTYFCRNQYALQAGVWSYLIIEVSTFVINSNAFESGMNLDTCQNIICDIWNKEPKMSAITSPFHNFPSTIDLRCNASSENFMPYYFLSSCIRDLCSYMGVANIPFSICIDDEIRNSSVINDYTNNTFSMIEKICPWDKDKTSDLTQQGIYLSICLKEICDYFTNFQLQEENAILNALCHTPYIENVNTYVAKLTEISNKTNENLESRSAWGKNTAASAIIIALSATAVSIISCWNAGLVLRISDEASSTSTSLYSLQQALGSMLQGTDRTLQSVSHIARSNPALEMAQHTELDTLLTQVRGLISDVRETMEHSFTYGEGAPIENERGSFNNVAGEEIKRLIFGSDLKEEGHFFISQDKATLEKVLVQQFIDDRIFNFQNATHLSILHLSHLKDLLIRWHNAFCVYRHRLFCRFPLEKYINETGAFIPMEYFEQITFSRAPGLCFSILNDLWCNWSKAIKMLTGRTDTLEITGYCPLDMLNFQVEQSEDNPNFYAINALGSCYNQTVLIKV